MIELENALTYEDWLWERTQDRCQDLGIEFVSIRMGKNAQAFDLYAEITQLIADIVTITDRTDLSIRGDFETASDAGMVTIVPDTTVLADTPTECQGSTHDARADAADACQAVTDAQTLKAWLEGELSTACDEETAELTATLNAAGARLGAMAAEKAANFATWAELAATTGEDAAAFEARMTAIFNTGYDDGSISRSDAGVTLGTVPDSCQDSTKNALEDLTQLLATLTQELTLCDWLEQ